MLNIFLNLNISKLIFKPAVMLNIVVGITVLTTNMQLFFICISNVVVLWKNYFLFFNCKIANQIIILWAVIMDTPLMGATINKKCLFGMVTIEIDTPRNHCQPTQSFFFVVSFFLKDKKGKYRFYKFYLINNTGMCKKSLRKVEFINM